LMLVKTSSMALLSEPQRLGVSVPKGVGMPVVDKWFDFMAKLAFE